MSVVEYAGHTPQIFLLGLEAMLHVENDFPYDLCWV